MEFPKLFGACHIGTLGLRNRIIMPPCTTNFAKDGFVTDRMKNFYATIAKGGVGMIVVEDAIVESSLGKHSVNDIHIDDDKYIPGLTQLVNCIKAHGAKAVLQLSHAGRRAGKILNGHLALTNGRIPIAPSSLAHFEQGSVVPRELTIYEIDELISKFATAAQRAKKAGFDAVGFHGSHGYLINQFLSPSSNKRQDEYGRDFVGRMRFLLRVVTEVQKRLGPSYPLLCRISGEEPFEGFEGGLSLEDMKEVARCLEKAGIQAFILSRGAARPPAATSKFISAISSMRIPRGCLVYLAEGIKEAVRVPVAAANRINDPVLAEKIIEDGKADLIAMGRALIADPELPNKAKEGRMEEIRTCIACMWCSQALGILNSHLVCAINAQVGREAPLDLRRVEKPKKILVIGGGPVGMEAARVAATRGHEVHLYESGPQLGGQLLAASKPPGKQEIDEFTRYLTGEVRRLGVAVKTSTPVTLTEIDKLLPDVLIIATGSKPLRPSITGIDQSNVVTAVEILQDIKDASGRVVVIGGGQVGAEVAEYLATKGRDVTIVEMMDQLAINSPVTVRTPLLLSLKENGVKIITRARAEKITTSGVVVDKSGKKMVIRANSVVLALGSEPDRALENKLAGRSALWVGDCVKPRNILESVREGFEAGAVV